jgi:hypothetical protein
MPLYEYHCEVNDTYVEVVHGMSVRFETWGELCDSAKIELGETPADTPVKKLIGSGNANNINATLGKRMKEYAGKSKHLNHGPMAAPPRGNRF